MTTSLSSDWKPPGVWHTYDSSNGLAIAASRLLQSHDGFLWIAGLPPGGIGRYDGVDFTYLTAKDGLPGLIFNFLYQDGRGQTWVGVHNTPGKPGLARYVQGRFEACEHEMFRTNCSAMTEDDEGRLWIAGVDRIVVYDGRTDEIITEYNLSALIPDQGRSLVAFRDSENQIWIGGNNGLLIFKKGVEGVFRSYVYPDIPLSAVLSITEDQHKRIWLAGPEGLVRFDDGPADFYQNSRDLPQRVVTCVYADSGGRIWTGGLDGGVTCLDENRFFTFTRQDGLYDHIVHDILEDREGNIWFAHSSGGLSRFEPDAVETLCDTPIPHYAFAQDKKGIVWFGSHNHLCWIEQDTVRQRTVNCTVEDLTTDDDGAIWLSDARKGLFRFPDTDSVYAGEPDLFSADCHSHRSLAPSCLAKDGHGRILAGGMRGLHQYTEHGFEQILDLKEMGPDAVIFHVCRTSAGMYWMGFWRSEYLARYDGEKFELCPQDSDPTPGYVRWIMERQDGRLWIATIGGGLYTIPASAAEGEMSDLVFEPFVFNDELQHKWISRLFEDAEGRLWIGTLTDGAYCYDGQTLQNITHHDGLPSSNIVGFAQQDDGSMVIGTQNGVVRYRPLRVCPPTVFIRSVTADRVYPGDQDIELTDTAAARITLQFRGISFRTHRLRYAYRLEGHDDGWQYAWEEDAVYEHLSPGDYRFQVTAVDRDFNASEIPASLNLTIRPDPKDEHIALLEHEVTNLRQAIGGKYDFDQIIGDSVAMQRVYGLMETAIDTGLTVFITGDTGTGKELVAKAIHYHSDRRSKPLQELNCGAMPRELIAATLFGYRKGAFTGAHEDTPGLFEAADGGTIFLDEIGEMTAEAQVHLLRVLQEQRFQRLGESTLRTADVRIVTATNRNLEEEIRRGHFREDLYYRLSVFPIAMPPLKDRIEDIPALVHYFVKRAETRFSKRIIGLTDEALPMLMRYRWPGNIRELENEIYRAAALADDDEQLQIYHFSRRITHEENLVRDAADGTEGYKEAVNRFRKHYVSHILRTCNGNRSEAAKRLRMHRPNLISLLKKLDIE